VGAAATAQPPSGNALTAGVRETVLPNGLKLVTKEVHSVPVVSFSVWYRVGSRNEHTGITGVSHLLEHMMFKGTRKYSLGQISRTLSVNGAEFNASTGEDRTNYWETLASDRLELAMQMEADRMVNSRVDKADLDSEMSVVRSELEGRENSPDELLYQAILTSAFQAHPYQWPVIGWRSDVENVPRDAIYQYYKTHYGPNNATVVIVGDFQTEPALALARKYFGEIKPIQKPPEVYTQEPPQRGERRVVVRRPGALPKVAAAYRMPNAKDPDYYALTVLGGILGQGRTSRLYQALVEKQLATDVAADAQAMRDPWLFFVGADAQGGVSADQLEAAMLAEVERIKTEPVTAEELARAKNRIEAAFVFKNDSVTQQADQLGEWDMTTGDWRTLSGYLERVRALTPADVQRVAQKYLVTDSRTLGQFIPNAESVAETPPTRENSARVEKGKPGEQVPLPRPSRLPPVKRNVSRFKLENGISLVVQENHSNPTVAIVGSLPAGRAVEPPDKPVAGITAAMLTRGTEKRTALEFAAALEGVGASLSAGGGNLTVSLSGHALSKDFDREMDLLAEMLRQPAFPAENLERYKRQVLASLEEEKDDPGSLAQRAFNRAVYPEGSPLRLRTNEEAQKAIASVTRDDVLNFYRQQYGPDRMILVVVGDVKAEQVREAVQSRLGSWARNPQAKPLPALDASLGEKPAREVIRIPDKSETAILWGFAGGLKRSDPDYYAAEVLNMVLGGGGALFSRLGNVIRDQQGLAYDVGSFYSADLYSGPFMVQLGTNPANAQKAIASLEAEVKRIREQGITQREVDEAVAYLTGSFPVSLESNAALANTLWAMEFYNLGPDYIDKYADLYRAVTVAQANAAAKKHLHPDRAITVLSGTVPEK
jgi:zinc protease